jgi:hypothetical protein
MADRTEIFEFLDDLRQSGETNMFGAAPYIEGEFGLSLREARVTLRAWMDSFSDEPASVRAARSNEGAQ